MRNKTMNFVNAIFILLAFFLTSVNAATFTVTNTDDSDAGSLRQAILDANGSAGADVIEFQVGLSSPISLTTGELTIIDDLTISGPGANNLSISGSNTSRVFLILADTTIDGVTIADGAGSDGAGIYVDYGASLWLTNSVVTNNAGSFAGAIRNYGNMSISYSTISGNSAAEHGGGILSNGAVTITNSTINNNSTPGNGGGITAGGTMTITNSTISGNSAFFNGGGIEMNGGDVTIINSTISYNSVSLSSGQGGGIGDGLGFSGGLMEVGNSIIANNTAAWAPDIFSASGTHYFTSLGYNIIGDISNPSGTDFIWYANTDQLGTSISPIDPLLGPLADNGGLTQTHALLAGSPAIDAGDCGASTEDQRGTTRPVGPACDIGTFESTVYYSDLTLTTQAEVDAFNYTQVTGILTISGDDITNLDGLISLTTVGKWLWVFDNSSLISIAGLSNVSFAGGLGIERNLILENIDELSGLTSVGSDGIWIDSNEALVNIDGLSGITETPLGAGIYIDHNSALTNVDGLSKLTSVGRRMSISGNPLLTDVNGLSSLTFVQRTFIIYGNAQLANLDGLSSLTTVLEGFSILLNDALTNLDGLSSLSTVGGLGITSNPVLAEFCGLYNLFNGGYSGSFYVSSNAENPTAQQILDAGPCHVPTPEELIDDLQSSVVEFGLPGGIKNSLNSSLKNAKKSLEKGNNGAAINQLKAFIYKVEAQSGKKIEEAEADQLISDAQAIIDLIHSGLGKNI